MTDTTECIHGIDTAWCSICKPPPPVTTLGDLYDAGKYEVANIYDLLDPDGEYTGRSVHKLHIGGKVVWAAYDGTTAGTAERPKLYRTLRAAKAALITTPWRT